METETGAGVLRPRAAEAWSHQEPGKRCGIPLWSRWPDRGPADTSTSNFRPPDRESVSFCCSGPWVGGDSLRPLWETNTLTNHGRFIGTQMSHERAYETQGRGGAIRRAALAGGVACSGPLGRCHSLGQRFESPRLPSRVGTAATSARHRQLPNPLSLSSHPAR